MNTLKTILLIILLLFSVTYTAFATPIKDGYEAYDRGDFVSAAKHFKLAAEQGDMSGQVILGAMYYHGEGVEQDYVKAARWLEAAAEQGNKDAQSGLGKMLQEGKGVEQDYVTAYKWLWLAAQRHDKEAANALLQLEPLMTPTQVQSAQEMADEWKSNNTIWMPRGALHDKEEDRYTYKLKWAFLKLLPVQQVYAEKGYPAAQLFLGIAYLNGVGVERDVETGTDWIRKAAEQNYHPAECELGRLYFDGTHRPKDYEQAMHWLKRAAKQGNALAALLVGSAYSLGNGVQRNLVQAYKWTTIAIQRGLKEADSLRRELIQDMSAEEIEHGQIQAKRWKPVKTDNKM